MVSILGKPLPSQAQQELQPLALFLKQGGPIVAGVCSGYGTSFWLLTFRGS